MRVLVTALRRGLAATIAWYQQHRDWWEPLKAPAALAAVQGGDLQ